MIISLMLSFFIPLSIGYFLVGFCWPGARSTPCHYAMKSSLAIGIGLGISSCIFFLWASVTGPSVGGPIITETGLLIGLVFLYKTQKHNYVEAAELNGEFLLKQTPHRILSISFYIVLISALASFILLSLKNPHGGWDAWATWNMRARFLFRGGDHWQDCLGLSSWSHPDYHPDYPLLLSGIVARCWKIIDKETLVVPMLISMSFTFATVGLIFSSLSVIRCKTQGFLAGLVLLGTPFFIEHGASQYADIPIGFFFLSTIVLFSLQDGTPKKKLNLLFLAGITTGLSFWTKNEGFLFLLSIIVAGLAVITLTKERKPYLGQMLPFAMGILPLAGIVIYFKTQLVLPNDLLSIQRFHTTMGRLADFSRYLTVGKAFVNQIFHFGGWVISIVIVLILYLFLFGVKIEEQRKTTIISSLIALCLMLAGYFLNYIIRSPDLHWHLRYSLNRLLLQLWPSFLFTFFLIAGPHESIANKLAPASNRAFCK